ncbi:hypothetical protein DL769_001994 [Monosporascus sp. CRB-8-3]|nr:hypothetical protein DL769_001994 [Monosporascus sp. CRB-8-3]
MSQSPLATGVRTLALVLLSLVCLPLSLIWALLASRWRSAPSGFKPAANEGELLHGRPCRPDCDLQRRTVLVTGIGMAKGLALARAFHLRGHRVIGADFETPGIPCPGRYSKALATFYSLPKPDPKHIASAYIRRLLEIVKMESADLWVSCSGVASAAEDAQAKEAIEQRTPCICIQFDVQTTLRLHEKDSFTRETKRLGLPVPETYDVTSADDALRILSNSSPSDPDRRFILKPAGIDDVHRGDMTLFPFSSPSDMKARISGLPISPTRPWILQQFIPGGEEYCTHALVLRGVVRCFVACPSAELLMHYEPLPATSALSRAMLEFTRQFVARSQNPESWTGHLSFDFMIEDGTASERGLERKLYAIECNPRAHTAVVLFNQPGPEMAAMVRAYTSAIEENLAGNADEKGARASQTRVEESLVVPPPVTAPRYWIGHDLVSLVLHRGYHVMAGCSNLQELLVGCADFAVHACAWKEGTFDAWDPWPALVLYHMYWPLTIISAWWDGRLWSRVNVSTTKVFIS